MADDPSRFNLFEERQRISEDVSKLSAELMAGVVGIIRKLEPSLIQLKDQQWEFDLAQLNNNTLSAVDNYVKVVAAIQTADGVTAALQSGSPEHLQQLQVRVPADASMAQSPPAAAAFTSSGDDMPQPLLPQSAPPLQRSDSDGLLAQPRVLIADQAAGESGVVLEKVSACLGLGLTFEDHPPDEPMQGAPLDRNPSSGSASSYAFQPRPRRRVFVNNPRFAPPPQEPDGALAAPPLGRRQSSVLEDNGKVDEIVEVIVEHTRRGVMGHGMGTTPALSRAPSAGGAATVDMSSLVPSMAPQGSLGPALIAPQHSGLQLGGIGDPYGASGTHGLVSALAGVSSASSPPVAGAQTLSSRPAQMVTSAEPQDLEVAHMMTSMTRQAGVGAPAAATARAAAPAPEPAAVTEPPRYTSVSSRGRKRIMKSASGFGDSEDEEYVEQGTAPAPPRKRRPAARQPTGPLQDVEAKRRSDAVQKGKDDKFQCDECAKKFRSRSDLRSHIRTHTGEKPLACKECGKRFAHSSNLRQHERSHTGEKRYACTWPGCKRKFAHPSSRNDHYATHTGERRYECDVPGCSKTFTAKANLTRHRRDVHKIEDEGADGAGQPVDPVVGATGITLPTAGAIAAAGVIGGGVVAGIAGNALPALGEAAATARGSSRRRSTRR